MLIVASGQRPEVEESDSVQVVCLSGNPKIGEARNIGCERARGEIIAHWDDDDWSNAYRLDDQVELLHRSQKPVAGYRSMYFTDGTDWWIYRGDADYAIGTSLVYRRDWWLKNRFRPVMVGEDNDFVSRARQQSAISVTDAGSMMYATIHKGNTSPRSLTASNYTPCSPLSF